MKTKITFTENILSYDDIVERKNFLNRLYEDLRNTMFQYKYKMEPDNDNDLFFDQEYDLVKLEFENFLDKHEEEYYLLCEIIEQTKDYNEENPVVLVRKSYMKDYAESLEEGWKTIMDDEDSDVVYQFQELELGDLEYVFLEKILAVTCENEK